MPPLTTRRILVLAAAILVVGLIAGRGLTGLYVEALWFDHLGFGGYFWTLKLSHWAVALTFGLLAGTFLFANLYPLTRLSTRVQIRRRYGDIEIAELFPRAYIVLAVIVIAALFGIAMGLYMGKTWTLPILQLVNAPEWGAADPVFSRDLSYYVFKLPVAAGVHLFAFAVVLGSTVVVLAAHGLTGGIQMEGSRLRLSALVRRHVGALAALTFLLLGIGYWLGLQQLLWSGHGPMGSLGYTDVHARFAARRILIGLSVAGAIASAAGAYKGALRYVVISAILLFVGDVSLGRVYPAIVQKLRVEPNEIERERVYLSMNISLTRMGYGLGRFDERSYPVNLSRAPAEEAAGRAASRLPLWDPRPLRATYNQFQGINPYYTFADVDYDRYGSSDDLEQVAVAVREIDIGKLPAEARTWQNLHLSENYTHGLGVVVSPASLIGSAGEPGYYVSGLPPAVSADAPGDIALEWPDVYFGEKTTEYVLRREEDERPGQPAALGVRIDSFGRKASFAWSLGDVNLLLSQELRPGTRILYERTVRGRVAKLAPFLILDSNIYPVLDEGRVVWVQDAYTATPFFPLSQRVATGAGTIGYIRNSVKVTVDALTGATRFYVVDPDDPLIASIAGAFPGLLRPIDEMPASLRRHLRYPEELLAIQARVLRAYHVTDPGALYNQIDLWDLPVERYREREELVRPQYVLMPDPVDPQARLDYFLIFPFTARGRDNMRAHLLARVDTSGVPQVTLLLLPAEQVLGPRQVEVQIDQDPVISQLFTLWQQRGSRVIRGHLLIIPVDSTFLYVEPIFLEAESGGAAPSLERVVVVSAGQVAMGETLGGALTALQVERPGDLAAAAPAEARGAVSQIDLIREWIARADSALRRSDLEAFGRAWEEIRRLAGRGGEQR